MSIHPVKICWRDPLVKIVLACFIIVILLIITLALKIAIYGNNPLTALSAVVTVPLAILVGPYLGLLQPGLGNAYLFALLTMFILILLGVTLRRYFWGRVIAVAGFVGWSFFGMLGMGGGI